MEQLINDSGSNLDKETLRAKFLEEYIIDKGWVKETLTNEQLKEIKSQKGYKHPGMLLS